MLGRSVFYPLKRDHVGDLGRVKRVKCREFRVSG